MDTAIRFRPAATTAFDRLCPPSTCECCGREDLMKTVKVVRVDGAGGPMWMGRGCAAKACGMGIREFDKAMKQTQSEQDAKEQAEREAVRRAEDAQWQAFLNETAGAVYAWPGGPVDRFRQLEKLGGYSAAKALYEAKKDAQ